MVKSMFVTDAGIFPKGEGGAVVSYHELEALRGISEVVGSFQRVGFPLHIEKIYPDNPLMYDHFINCNIPRTCNIDAAHFYGGNYPTCIRRFENAVRTMTIPSHNLELSLQEWTIFNDEGNNDVYGPRFFVPLKNAKHLVIPWAFDYLTSGRHFMDKVICPGKVPRDYFMQKYDFPEEKMAIVPHGNDVPEVPNDYDSEEFNVIHIGRSGWDKGDRYLVGAWIKLVRELHVDGSLMMGGGGMSLIQEGLESHGLTDLGFVIKDYLSEEEKEYMYRYASVYVQPSVTEGWGIPVGEAMAHGIPAIVSDRTGAVDMIEDGVNGFVVPIRDPDAIVEKVMYFYENPGEIKRMGKNARETALNYTWDKIEEKYKVVWRELYEEKGLI